ncbi:MAG: hypothetical protein JWO76_863, partial [Nocardioides sp.]|nr:hypothetical protein [Nocardioides sp.]
MMHEGEVRADPTRRRVLAPALTGMSYYWDSFPAFARLS